MSDHSLAQWYGALSSAIRASDIEAVPHLLVHMALDGYGHEAEEFRRQSAAVLSAANGDDQ